MSDVAEKLVAMFEAGELVPVGTIKSLKSFAPATVCRWCLTGKLPAIRVGRRILTHPDLVRDALAGFVIKPNPPEKPGPKLPGVQESKDRLRARGLKV